MSAKVMNVKVNGMTTCVVCGRDFPLIAEEHYIARGATDPLGPEVDWYDAIDCPWCGCQNVLGTRNRDIDLDFYCDECPGCPEAEGDDD